GRALRGVRPGVGAAGSGMGAAEVPAAAIAAAAGPLRRLGVLAKEKLSDALGQRELADAARAVQQQGMRQALAGFLQRIEDRLVPGMHQRPCSADLICLRTAAASAEASMTCTRTGSSSARARYAARTRSKKARSSRSKRSSVRPALASRALATS